MDNLEKEEAEEQSAIQESTAVKLQKETDKPKAHGKHSNLNSISDPHFTLKLMPPLSNLCLQSIVSNFEENPIFEQLQPCEKDFIFKHLFTDLPLHITANLISDGVYWRRCCEQQWSLCDVSDYGHSWKRMFFERQLESMIELFVPDVTNPDMILDMVHHCGDYIKRLSISQLLLSNNKSSGDHFDFSILLDKLTSLKELHLRYRVKNCGIKFEWKMLEMSDRDCESLAKAIESCKTLKCLRIQLTNIDDNQCQLLVKHLLDHPNLRELDFSHNLISDGGAKAIAELLTRSKLEILNLFDNDIKDKGAKQIAHALSKNSTLLSLNLRLNRVKDEGGQAISEALLKNNTLRYLHLGGNEVTGPTAIAMSEVLAQNKTLKSINLSCNNLGELNDAVMKHPSLRLSLC